MENRVSIIPVDSEVINCYDCGRHMRIDTYENFRFSGEKSEKSKFNHLIPKATIRLAQCDCGILYLRSMELHGK